MPRKSPGRRTPASSRSPGRALPDRRCPPRHCPQCNRRCQLEEAAVGAGAQREAKPGPVRQRANRSNAPERDHLHWDSAVQHRRCFCVVDDHDETRRGAGDDLLAHHRAPPSFDESQRGIDRVCAVHRDVEAISAELFNRDAMRRSERGTRLRRCDGADRQAGANPLGQPDDEPVRRRSGAEADAHALGDKGHCRCTGSATGCVDVHPRSVTVRRRAVPAAQPSPCVLPRCAAAHPAGA